MTLFSQSRLRAASIDGRAILEAAGCTALFLMFALQQVVIGHGLGEGLSLGSAAMRLFAVAASVALLWRHGVPHVCRLPLAAILACLCVLAVSALVSEHRLIAVKFAVRYATQLAMLWCILNLVVAYPRLHAALVRAAVATLWIGILVGLCSRWSIGPGREIALMFHSADVLRYLPRISGLYEHPAIFGAVAVLVAVLATQFYGRGVIGRPALAAALAGLAVALVLTEARNPLVPLLLLATGFVILRRGRARRIALALLALLVCFVAVAIWRRYDELTSASRETLLTMFSLGRTYIWAGAIDAWREHPWFGLGPGVFQFLTPDFTGGRFLRGELHAHNLVLGILSETGLAGLLAFAGLVGAFVAPVLRNGDPAMLRWAAIWLVTAFGLGLFDFYLPFYGFSLHLALAAGLFLALAAQNDPACRERNGPHLP
jgi:O-antigen ligase